MRAPRARSCGWIGLWSVIGLACRVGGGGDGATRPAVQPATRSGSSAQGSESEAPGPAGASSTKVVILRSPPFDGSAKPKATTPDLALERAERAPPASKGVSLPNAWPVVPPAARLSAWCVEGLNTLGDASCYALPPKPTRTLLIYLHGIVPPRDDSPEKTHVQTVIKDAALRTGIVVIVPRGRAGFGPRGRESWVGWPTTQVLYDRFTKEILHEFAAEREKLEEMTGVTFSPVYLAGSSSGAYFVTRLALRGGIDVDGFGAMSGGTSSEVTDLTGVPARPFYIGYGKYDGYVRRAIPTLADLLRRAHWPLRVAEHPVDHGARPVYFEEALAFWRENAL